LVVIVDGDRGAQFEGQLVGEVLDLLPGLRSPGPDPPAEDDGPAVGDPAQLQGNRGRRDRFVGPGRASQQADQGGLVGGNHDGLEVDAH
jgi:hypothetical protein